MSTIEGLDKDMLATLTDEEREAFEPDAMSDDERAAMKAVAEGADDDEDEDDGDEAAPAAAPAEGKGAAPAADDQADKKDEAAAATQETEDDEDATDGRPRYTAKLPADYADQVAALKTESADLAKQFKDGDIDLDEFQLKQAEIAERRDALTVARTKAEISEEMNSQTDEQVWQGTIAKFMRATAKAGDIDYLKDEAKMADLDQFVKVLSNNSANDDKPGEWFLREAHKRVRALHGLTDGKPADPEPPKPNTKRAADVSAIPATLAQVPGGDGPGDLAGEFADMDGLEGEELERAIARMTPAQREKFAMVM